MISLKRTIALALTGICLATSGIVMAGETGRKNTRNALGAFTVIEAVKGHKGAALAGAAGTIAAQHQLDKSIRKRHERAAYRHGYRRGRRSVRRTHVRRVVRTRVVRHAVHK